MFHAKTLLLFCCFVASGCSGVFDDPASPDVGASSGIVTWSEQQPASPGTDQASVYHVGTMFVVWSSLPNGGGGDVSANMHGTICRGQLLGAGGEILAFACESKDGSTGTATIDGRTYDLTDGSLFLVASKGKSFRIKQLARDLKALRFDPESLQSWAARDEEFNQFFTPE